MLTWSFLFKSKKVFILIVVIKRPLVLKIFAAVKITQEDANTSRLEIFRTRQPRMVLEHGKSITRKPTRSIQQTHHQCTLVFRDIQLLISVVPNVGFNKDCRILLQLMNQINQPILSNNRD